jgi:uncharacterized protein YbgA (DUF1722 family)/uncharacterized protein YbbK (DUF523 family)
MHEKLQSGPDRTPIRIGVSACLIGERVRYDGADKRDAFITETLGAVFDWVPICPEVAIGMGVPRLPIRLVGDIGAPQALGVDEPGLDVTAALNAYGRRAAGTLQDIDGYIFKARSPSCGPLRVPVYASNGRARRRGVGLYAREIATRQPLLPIVDEEQLADRAMRDSFIERVFAHRRWRRMLASGFSLARLMEFHSIHKLSLMAHGAVHYRTLGQCVAAGKGLRPAQLRDAYGTGFMAALKIPATPKRHANVLQHLMGYLKKQLNHSDKTELLEVIDAYRVGHLPLIAPLTLLRHHFRRFPHPYVEKQVYLYPETAETQLRHSA